MDSVAKRVMTQIEDYVLGTTDKVSPYAMQVIRRLGGPAATRQVMADHGYERILKEVTETIASVEKMMYKSL